MPTLPLSDETLAETVRVFMESGSQTKAADILRVTRSTLQNRLLRAAQRGLDGSVPKPIPPGQIVKGVSTLYDAGGNTVLQWVKTKEDGLSIEGVVDAIKDAFKDYEGRAVPAPAPDYYDADLLNLFPCNDWHINLLTWSREVGENWDLRIAEETIGEAMESAIERAPGAAVGVVLGGGDLIHADTNENRTARSGNVLDADGRHQKGLEIASRLMVRTVDAALLRNERVMVRILSGNHDEYSSVAIAYFLLAWYRNEPRVTVDVDPSLYWWFRWGEVLLGATHGHTIKPDQMPAIMAHRRAKDWGETRFRYAHTFHLHHKRMYATEGGGVICEVHQAPIPQDAWHYGSGFLSGRSLQAITYHSRFGEVSRSRVAILDAP